MQYEQKTQYREFQKTGISRSNLYAIFNGEQQPQLTTALKIIKELGYTVQVA